MENVDTLFAPAERADVESILRDAESLSRTGLLDHITHVIPSILVILNKQRQVVYANERLLELLGTSLDQVLGKRPGELLDCIHAHERAAGCGTTEFCRECGAVKAILKAQREKVGVEEECRITTASQDSYEFRVWASPYLHGGADFTLFTLLEISDEKRRETLERAFFHDISNILHLIVGYSYLLSGAENDEVIGSSIMAIQLAVKELTAEITSHRKLLQAEKGQLSLDLTEGVSSLEFAEELAHMSRRSWDDRPAVRMTGCNDFIFTTDRSLLFRVLYNMIKNAFEASSSSEVVSISCKQEGSSGIFSVHNPDFMPRATQLQVFQRSFSTKGKGRGIGTYSMKLFGEKYLKGKVWFSTSKAEGTTFFVSVPLSYEDARQPAHED